MFKKVSKNIPKEHPKALAPKANKWYPATKMEPRIRRVLHYSIVCFFLESMIGEDCDDWANWINPGVGENCGDSVDNNCDGQIDENCFTATTPGAITFSGYNSNFVNNGQMWYEWDFCGSSQSVSFTLASTGGSAITNYQYSVGSWNGSTYVPTTWNDFSPAKTSSPITFSGLNNINEYFYFLRAKNAVGTGSASALIYLYGCNVY